MYRSQARMTLLLFVCGCLLSMVPRWVGSPLKRNCSIVLRQVHPELHETRAPKLAPGKRASVLRSDFTASATGGSSLVSATLMRIPVTFLLS
jgi:hypothetical protein